MARYALRTGPTNHKVELGKVYELRSNDSIIGDHDRVMRPCLDRPDYWIVLPEWWELGMEIPPDIFQYGTKEDSKMTEINVEHKVFLNGSDLDDWSYDEVFHHIQEVERTIADLSAIKSKPKALVARIAEHKKGLKELIKVLDEGYEE